ncbi:hypothetical protein VMCG_09106 [Cytospora schulzeri]|uniref:Uncharacterized protein n=1 Tax=Cytospora schulzeri TaxID=448051 RepID=A0A423VMZ4_9PEZI|nr:hypothetical protein VMCG_09106 [Valsa malicola]
MVCDGTTVVVNPTHAFSPPSRRIRADEDAVLQELSATQLHIPLTGSRTGGFIGYRGKSRTGRYHSTYVHLLMGCPPPVDKSQLTAGHVIKPATKTDNKRNEDDAVRLDDPVG